MLSRHQLHMKPRDLEYQRVIGSRYEFVPQPASVAEHLDYFGNAVTTFLIDERTLACTCAA